MHWVGSSLTCLPLSHAVVLSLSRKRGAQECPQEEPVVEDGSAPPSKCQKTGSTKHKSNLDEEEKIATLPVTISWNSAQSIEKHTAAQS
ncbi:hypothetical protein K469DRAFT_714868 [Zopfia rhizophila CBS 207.26]|uniref:Uncharacterized protein n=1 Tax=Zopfia rhizophila CBS 207.26 TaxID=1314779 RepID=A0A6A6ESJ3_9PEZI|nr:hypothetical protein K469DRAFT_714868 [Zopfia rhizophila CBS 207.26]